MSRGKQEAPKSFNKDKYEQKRDNLKLTDRQVCDRIRKLHIIISKDPLYPDDPDHDRIVTCSPQNLTKAKKEGRISPAILDAIGRVLDIAPEHLSDEIPTEIVTEYDSYEDMVAGKNGKKSEKLLLGTDISYDFHKQQEYYNLSPEEEKQFFDFELRNLGIRDKWLKMNSRQRNNCHTAIRIYANWLLDFYQPDEEGYRDMYDFFDKTGIQMDKKLRQELFKTLMITYKTFMEVHNTK